MLTDDPREKNNVIINRVLIEEAGGVTKRRGISIFAGVQCSANSGNFGREEVGKGIRKIREMGGVKENLRFSGAH